MANTYVCIDGGQTKTSVSVLDEEGVCSSSWEADPLTTPSKPGALEGLRAVASGICEELGRRFENAEIAFPQAMCFSLTGYLEGGDRIPVLVEQEVREVLPAVERVHTVPDHVEAQNLFRRPQLFSPSVIPSLTS